MTALCQNNGPSSMQPQAATLISMTAEGLAVLLGRIPLPWAIGLSAVLAGTTWNMLNACATDPPPMPTMTAADMNALLQMNDLHAVSVATGKLKDIVLNRLWFDNCQCNSGPQPTFPPAPPAPVGAPVLNPPASTTPPLAQPCIPLHPGWSMHNDTFGWQVTTEYSAPFPSTPPTNQTGLGIRVSVRNVDPAVHPTYSVDYSFVDINGYTLQTIPTISLSAAPGGVSAANAFYPIPANSYIIRAVKQSPAQISADVFAGFLDYYCNGQTPNQPTGTPCCPPDVTTQQSIAQLFNLVTVMQRQYNPFAYIKGAVHSNISGFGQFPLPQCIGVLVTTTTLPSTIGTEEGNPLELFDLGWINWGNADGWKGKEKLTVSPQLSIPRDGVLYNQIGYSLPPGVVVSIQELYREP